MSEMSKAKVIGETPNEIWMRTGQVIAVVGALSTVGFKGFGFQVVSMAGAAPLILIFVGCLVMYIGTRYRKILHQARQQHEIALERAAIPEQKPTSGDDAVLEAFKLAERPMGREDTAHLSVSYYDQMTKPRLLESMKIKSIDYWIRSGEIVRDNGWLDVKGTD